MKTKNLVLIFIFLIASLNQLSLTQAQKNNNHQKMEIVVDKFNRHIIYNDEIFSFEGFMSFLEPVDKPENILEESPFRNVTQREFTFFLTIFAGLMSGLTVGYLSIDDLVLELKVSTGTVEEKKHAEKVLPILSQRHWLLVTLLLCNAFAMEALPIFLNRIVSEYLAVIISVTLVLIFGEIVPQAVCVGPQQIKIASFLAPAVKFLMYITYPFSYPISKILDYVVGGHVKSRFLNSDLKALIELHTLDALQKIEEKEVSTDTGGDMGLNHEQANLMINAIEMKERKIIEIMLPLTKAYCIDFDEVLDKMKVNIILDKGFSRIPVYYKERNNIIGILRIKKLVGISFDEPKSLRQIGLELRRPLAIRPDLTIFDALRELKKGISHMAMVSETIRITQSTKNVDILETRLSSSTTLNRYAGVNAIGIVTLEDILEKLINVEILDEDDYERLNKIKTEATKKYNRLVKDMARTLIKEESYKLNNILEHSFRPARFLSNKTTHDSFHSQYKEPLL